MEMSALRVFSRTAKTLSIACRGSGVSAPNYPRNQKPKLLAEQHPSAKVPVPAFPCTSEPKMPLAKPPHKAQLS
jgi:hypothetical protein